MKVLIAIDEDSGVELEDFLFNRSWTDDCEVLLVNIVRPLILNYAGDPAFADLLERKQEEIKQDAANMLEIFAGKLKKAAPRLKLSKAIAEGSPSNEILSFAESFQADLIVLGAHRYRGMEQLLLGSVSKAVAANAKCSVAAVRRLAKEGLAESKRVLVAVEDQNFARLILDFIKENKWSANTIFKVVHVVEPVMVGKYTALLPSPILEEMETANTKAGHELVKDAAKEIESSLPETKVETEVISGFAKRALNELISRWKPELMLVGSHGRNFVTRIFLGSVSTSMLEAAPCSVVVVRKKGY